MDTIHITNAYKQEWHVNHELVWFHCDNMFVYCVCTVSTTQHTRGERSCAHLVPINDMFLPTTVTAGCFASELVLVWPVVATTTSRPGWHGIKKWPGKSDPKEVWEMCMCKCFPLRCNLTQLPPKTTLQFGEFLWTWQHERPGCEALGSMDRTWSRWNVGGKMWWRKNLSEDCT